MVSFCNFSPSLANKGFLFHSSVSTFAHMGGKAWSEVESCFHAEGGGNPRVVTCALLLCCRQNAAFDANRNDLHCVAKKRPGSLRGEGGTSTARRSNYRRTLEGGPVVIVGRRVLDRDSDDHDIDRWRWHRGSCCACFFERRTAFCQRLSTQVVERSSFFWDPDFAPGHRRSQGVVQGAIPPQNV